MRILLVHPYITSDSPHGILTEPLGLICLASYLSEHSEHNVEILDLFALGFNKIEKIGPLYRKGLSNSDRIISLISEYNPDVIGITCNFTACAPDTFEIAKLIKDNFRVILVLGGAHATIESENILKNNQAVDIVVKGEGEVTLKELLEAIEQGRNFEFIEGISYKNRNGEIKSNPKRKLIGDLDCLPLPDRKKLAMEVYLKTNRMALPFAKRQPIVSIMTSRGCPYDCVFCSTKVVWERRWRPRSPQKVIEEIEMLIRDYGIKEVAIYDDQFMADKNRVQQICDLLIEKALNITLSIPAGTSVWLADEDLLKKMKKAGFYRLCFPIETGNEKTLKFIKKPVNLTKAKKTIELTNRIGIWTQGNFIIGFPYETKQEIQTTIDYAFQSGLDYAIFFIAKPYAGSEMYEIFKKEGLLVDIARGSNIDSADYDTKTMKTSELQLLRDKASRHYLIAKALFYLNPINFYNYLLPKISSKEDIVYAVKILFRISSKYFLERFCSRQNRKIDLSGREQKKKG